MTRGRERPKKPVPPSTASPLQIGGTSQRNTDGTTEAVPQSIANGGNEGNGEDDVTSQTLETPIDNTMDKKLWVEVLSGNRNPGKGMKIEFVTPKVTNGEIEVEIDESDIVNEVKFWDSALIMYVLGGELSMNGVKQFMIKMWNFVKLPDMYYNEEGYFILRFHSYADRDVVLMGGPYTIRNMPMLLREWKPNFNLKNDMLRTLPIWVKLPQLPLYLWGVKSLSKIGSALGTPLVTDECTANKFRISYARILVEVDITQELATEITIKDSEGGRMKQPVEYEWKPTFCDKCQKFGHQCGAKKRPEKNWVPKVTTKEVNEEQKSASQKVPTPTKLRVVTSTNNDPDNGEWTTVCKGGKDRGEKPIAAGVICDNGFETLGMNAMVFHEDVP
ncbi:unnamed protein product [Trifolium pratense]|uniref:Uncharacterized protein n=1 Tax=Trifolium pratense TaxID=57577 RepID=A0ACB0IIY7_TRIPR|nr:unnamed protein product [Trifolium pratense]